MHNKGHPIVGILSGTNREPRLVAAVHAGLKEAGFVEGHVTGATFLVNSLAAKRMEFLHELLPAAPSIGVLVNPKNPAADSELKDIHAAAKALGHKLQQKHGTDHVYRRSKCWSVPQYLPNTFH